MSVQACFRVVVRMQSVILLLVSVLTVACVLTALPRTTYAASNTNTFDASGDPNCPTNSAVASGGGAACISKHILAPIVATLTALTAVLVIISIIIAGIQYSSAGSDPSKIAAARGRIVKAVIALAVFMFLYAIVNWIIPGGIKNGTTPPPDNTKLGNGKPISQ